ncbi:hypothetical protein WR25_06687 isoform A [Diploscapter pachys]|uniref:Tubulin-specific chaperone D n=1 Tax=Diploscapter pachys TaxID=2018661 RepID=A0A2A2K0Q0_9BILA|nr:hypothetical protein WR25_06687 isoform A [Diploscapter pachys]
MHLTGESSSRMEEGNENEEKQEDEEEGVVGCIPRLLDAGHRQEILQIVDSLPEAVNNGDIRILELKLDRYSRLISLYQEQPSLLDCIIPDLLKAFLSYIDLSSARLNDLSITAFHYLACLTKVRGYKVIMRLMPHEVTYLEKLLTVLNEFAGPCGEDQPQRFMLLLWLWIVCKNPFDLRRFDRSSDRPGETLNRIFSIVSKYLEYEWDRTQVAASLVIAQCLSRTDGIPLIGEALTKPLFLIQKIEPEISEPVGHLLLVAAILKKVDRVHLKDHVDSIASAIRPHFPLNSKLGDLTRKCLVKVLQRLALVLLRPKLAAWRYRRGRRKLEENLVANGTATNAEKQSEVQNGAAHVNGVETDCAMEEEEEIEAPHEIVEWALGCILNALSDENTYVRWSAAKGIGRITARLPKELASQVVESILSSNFHRLAGHCSWHGGCMALAEMTRRGFLLPDLLPSTFPVVEEALFYEEPMGRQGLGNQVRDAACYILWAFARAYEPTELRPYVDKVATSLICAALFDREVNLRRAASAAFQENVGRQADFPDGIPLLTLVDYFAVGYRLRCFEQLAVQAAAFPKYAIAIVDHLVERKVVHWDEAVREQAALSLEKLAEIRPDLVAAKLNLLVEGCRNTNPIHRHGYILAAARAIKGLTSKEYKFDQQMITKMATLPEDFVEECKKFTSVAGLLTRKALCGGMQALAQANFPLTEQQINFWMERIETFASDKNERVRQRAIDVAEVLIPGYIKGQEKIQQLIDNYCDKLEKCSKEEDYIGLCAVAACVSRSARSYRLFTQLCAFVTRCRESTWAKARAASVDALPVVLPNAAGTSKETADEAVAECFAALERALNDYATNSMGDIGRFVRQSGMHAMARILTQQTALIEANKLTRYVLFCLKKMIEQSAGKIGRTRECAAQSIFSLLEWDKSNQPSLICHAEQLAEVYTKNNDFVRDTVLLSLVPLLHTCPEYFDDLMHGLVMSAGGQSEITKMRGRQALLSYLETYAYGSLDKLESFFGCVADLLERGMKQPRIGMSVLRYLPQALGHLDAIESAPDSSASLQRILRCLVKVSASPNAPPVRIRLVIDSFASLLNFATNSATWKTAANQIVHHLLSSTPVLRRSAAEALYEALCISCSDETVSQSL